MRQIVGQFLNSRGVPVPGARMFLQLTQDAVASGSAQVSGGSLVAVVFDGNGQIPTGSKIWFNDELTPSTTGYLLSVVAPGGGLIYGPEYFIFEGQGPLNVFSMLPSLR